MSQARHYHARNATDPGPYRPEPDALARIRVVLVATAQARNIGSVARAMKVMGLNRLSLVNPVNFPHQDAIDLAAGASDILETAHVCSSLAEALGDCAVVFGASARRREIPLPEFGPRAGAEHAVGLAQAGAQIALVFGAETAGLSNQELEQCQYLLQIPANPAFASLNLAAAAQIVCYEIRLAALSAAPYQPRHIPAAHAEFEHFFTHLVNTAEQARFFANKTPETAQSYLRRMFQRMQGTNAELAMLRGLLSQLQKAMRQQTTL